MDYIEKKYIKRGVVEHRDYQVNLAREAIAENCIVVLPTGLGKTTVAMYVMAEYLARNTGGALFLAPTRVLVGQHYDYLRDKMTLEDISLVTGEDAAQKRKRAWIASVVCATPEIARNDFARGMVHPSQFNLVVFDEVHRAVGDYAYTAIAQRFVGRDVRIMGMTATLPSEIDKATEIVTRLRVSRVAERTDSSDDVKPYVQDTATDWIMIDLPPEMIRMQRDLKRALSDRYDILRKQGFANLGQPSLSVLLKIRPQVFGRHRGLAAPLFAAIRIHYALNILEAHGITPFLKFCERTRKKGGPGTVALLDHDPLFSRTIRAATQYQAKGLEHPKIDRLQQMLNGISGRVLIFASYRDTVDVIHALLQRMQIPAAILIGKAGEGGLKQKKQIETVQKFRDGQYRALIATRVGEEGLDIAEVNHVIFYDNVPSSIRYIQRKGRTGRRGSGKLIVLIAKNTIDETYYWVGKRKIKAAGNVGSRITRMLNKNKGEPVQTGLDAFS